MNGIDKDQLQQINMMNNMNTINFESLLLSSDTRHCRTNNKEVERGNLVNIVENLTPKILEINKDDDEREGMFTTNTNRNNNTNSPDKNDFSLEVKHLTKN